MYIPRHFAQDDPAILRQFMIDHNFAALVTQQAGQLMASHLPFMLAADEGEYGTLYSHLARANPQWGHFAAGAEAMVIFQGAHTYISPTLYENPAVNVPTWNYAVVHAYGIPQPIDDPAHLRRLLDALVDHHEAGSETPYSTAQAEAHVQRTLPGAVAFRLPITRLEGKFKLSQNRSLTDRARVREALSASDHPHEQAVAALMNPETPK
jgi:transcriptional regulator